jgi:hypothetical protein
MSRRSSSENQHFPKPGQRLAGCRASNYFLERFAKNPGKLPITRGRALEGKNSTAAGLSRIELPVSTRLGPCGHRRPSAARRRTTAIRVTEIEPRESTQTRHSLRAGQSADWERVEALIVMLNAVKEVAPLRAPLSRSPMNTARPVEINGVA